MASNDKPRLFTVTVVVGGNTTVKVSLMLKPGTAVEQESGVTVELTPSEAQRPGEDGAIKNPLKSPPEHTEDAI